MGSASVVALASRLLATSATPTRISASGFPIARTIGNCLSLAGYGRLVDFVGPAKAKELIMLAKLLTADEALSLGVVTEIVPADQLEDPGGRGCFTA